MSNINISSISSLEELEATIGRFASEAREAIESAQRQIRRKTELLDQIVADRRRAVAGWQSACDESEDEEDNRSIQKNLEEAEEELREAKKWQRRVEEACADYKKQMNQAHYLAEKHNDKARLFLRARIEELHSYVGLKPHFSQSQVSAGSVTSAAETSSFEITSIPLPQGFGWLLLDDLMPDEIQTLPAESDYRKGVSEAEMMEGLRLLQTQILPEIQKDPNAAVEHFAGLDAAEKRVGANSFADIFRAYFGTDHQIRVSRFRGDRFFRIENGRHRIKAAKSLGWNAVPAQIIEVPSKANQD